MSVNVQTLEKSREDHLAFQTVESVIRQHSRTFFFATSLLPRVKRRAIHALYAFCRATDDLVDRQNASLEDVTAWREKLHLPLDIQDNPMLRTWHLTREAYQVNPQYQEELIDGVARDIAFTPFTTWEDLSGYCYQVASTVGLLSIPIIGLADGYTFEDAAPYAIQLGIALQLTNILRDVGEDLEKGRIYLPQADLASFSLTLEDIRCKTCDERFIALMKYEIARARNLFDDSLPGIALLHRSVRLAVTAAALVYRAILDEIETMAYRVYDQRAFTSNWQKIRMLPGLLRTVRRLQAPSKSGA